MSFWKLKKLINWFKGKFGWTSYFRPIYISQFLRGPARIQGQIQENNKIHKSNFICCPSIQFQAKIMSLTSAAMSAGVRSDTSSRAKLSARSKKQKKS